MRNEFDDAVFRGMGQHLTTASQIYRGVALVHPGRTKDEIDASLGKLQDTGWIILHEHTAPSDPDRSTMIHYKGKVYVGGLRRKVPEYDPRILTPVLY